MGISGKDVKLLLDFMRGEKELNLPKDITNLLKLSKLAWHFKVQGL